MNRILGRIRRIDEKTGEPAQAEGALGRTHPDLPAIQGFVMTGWARAAGSRPAAGDLSRTVCDLWRNHRLVANGDTTAVEE
jgi:hypothetical protein